MPWLLALCGHHPPWYQLYKIVGPLPPMGTNLIISTTCSMSVLKIINNAYQFLYFWGKKQQEQKTVQQGLTIKTFHQIIFITMGYLHTWAQASTILHAPQQQFEKPFLEMCCLFQGYYIRILWKFPRLFFKSCLGAWNIEKIQKVLVFFYVR